MPYLACPGLLLDVLVFTGMEASIYISLSHDLAFFSNAAMLVAVSKTRLFYKGNSVCEKCLSVCKGLMKKNKMTLYEGTFVASHSIFI